MSFKLSLSFVAILAVVATALPVPTEDKQKAVYDVLPEELKNFHASLTEADMRTFSELAPQLAGQQPDKVYELIKARDPELADRIKAVFDNVDSKIAALPEEPKKFMTDLLEAVVTFQFDHIHEVRKEGEALPEEAKDAILAAFPTLGPILKA